MQHMHVCHDDNGSTLTVSLSFLIHWFALSVQYNIILTILIIFLS